jgi:hypothetical protein
MRLKHDVSVQGVRISLVLTRVLGPNLGATWTAWEIRLLHIFNLDAHG